MSIQTIAIIIGISSYLQDEIPDLPAAEIDAVNFARALRNWGIPEKNILLLLNEKGNRWEVDNFFETLAEMKENYKFLFYFCGHGHRTLNDTPKSYLIFHDSHLKSNECLNSFSLDFFIEKIAKMNILESYIFIDACHLRVNTFINPKLEEESRGKIRSDKSLFCLLSSGIEESFENVSGQYGYFTKALLNSLCRIRKSEGSPTQFLIDIQNEMKSEHLPLPDMVNFGNQKISFIPNAEIKVDDHGKIYRNKFISEIQDTFIQNPNKIIFLFGEEGYGKTTICEWLASEKTKTIYVKIPSEINVFFEPVVFLEQNICEKFNCSLDEFEIRHPFYLVIIDQLEKLNSRQCHVLFQKLCKSILRFLCVSRSPLEHSIKVNSDLPHIYLEVPPLSKEEGRVFIKSIKPDYSSEDVEFSYLISKGNPLKIKKNLQIDRHVDSLYLENVKKAIAAVYSCGEYYDKFVFEKVFNLQLGMLDFFESTKLILSLNQSFVQ